jgi:hypothetical protein
MVGKIFSWVSHFSTPIIYEKMVWMMMIDDDSKKYVRDERDH